MNDVDASIEKAITKFQIVMLYLNKEIIEMVNESSLTNLLSREQIEAMRIIQTKGQVTINELAGLQNIFKTAASKRIGKLEEMGYVQRAHSNNKRIKLVKLSLEGETFLKQATAAMTESVKNRLGNQFSLEEIEDFVNQLERIDEAFRKSK